MKMKTSLMMATIAAGITLAAAAEAQSPRGERPQMPSFADLDLNSDGGVTQEEMAAHAASRAEARFTQTDANGDDALSAEEMLAHAETQRAERLATRIADRIEKADANGDGLLQQSELQAQADERAEGRGDRGNRVFERFDEDEDGTLSAEEFAKAAEAAGERGERRPGGERGERGQQND